MIIKVLQGLSCCLAPAYRAGPSGMGGRGSQTKALACIGVASCHGSHRLLSCLHSPSHLASAQQPCQTSIRVSPAPSQAQTRPIFNVLREGSHLHPSSNCQTLITKPAQHLNTENCFDNSSHLSLLHVCSYCLRTIRRHCYHIEMYCQCKGATKQRSREGSNPDIPHSY